MKILILTLADEPYWPIARISNPNKAAYAARHGYDFRAYSHSNDTRRPTSWSKLQLVANALEEYDWVFWTDADSLIMNSEMPLEYIIDKYADMIAAADENGLNTGQFLASPRAFDILIQADVKDEEFMHHPWWEQAAIHAVLKENPQYRVKVVDQSKLNRLVPSGPEHNTFEKMVNQVDSVWKRGDFILHFSGIGGERAPLRLALMEDYLECAR